jgi:ATP-dependent Lhr-like helicase
VNASSQEPSEGFDRLHPKVQQWIWQQGWRTLREAQEAAIAPLLAADTDVLIAAATASGKTEAAFLPICSTLVGEPPAASGMAAIYISPLKALINDQYGRLDRLCEHLGIPVTRWHGDVGSERKSRLLEHSEGILLITPESLEALFVTRGWKMPHMVGALRYIVVDELHCFIGSERGAQLQSLMHRLDLAVRRRVPRVGLSATLGDMPAAADFLRPGGGGQVTLVTAASDTQELRLQLRGYIETAPTIDPRTEPALRVTGAEVSPDDTVDGAQNAIADHLFTTLRGAHNLIFANSRRAVETYTDLLNHRSQSLGVPNEFVPHHGNLSKDIREHAEARLKDRARPATAVCTSTLEMGIDIGSVSSVAQIGAPPGVAALRQRLGRSGRRGDPAVLRVYISEPELTGTTPPADELRAELVQAIAGIQLLLDRWYEPPQSQALHLSTLVQQLLSLIAQHGGVTPLDAYRTLCAHGPFRAVDQGTFATLLRDLGAADYIRQETDGLLLHGQLGERLVNHYSFYAAFAVSTEYRIVTEGRTLGTLPLEHTLPEGALLIFAGRRWRILAVDARAKAIEVAKASGGRPPRFQGVGPDVHDRIRIEMRRIYEDTRIPVYLDATAQRLLDEGRAAYRRLGLHEAPFVAWGKDTILFPFRGDIIMTTLALALHSRGVTVERQGIGLTLADTSPETAADLLTDLAASPMPDAADLAQLVPDKTMDKHDEAIGDELLTRSYAIRRLDVPQTWQALTDLAARADANRATHLQPLSTPPPRPADHRIGALPYAVVDLETTSLDARRARIVEIAIIRLHPDGTPARTYTTLVNPQTDPGPTHLHGLTAGDVVAAPCFIEIAGDVAEMLSGAVLVAHNARYDAEVLSAEFARAGAAPDDLLSLCTLTLARRFGTPAASHQLSACAAAEGLRLHRAHAALSDAEMTAELLRRYVGRAVEQGAQWLSEIGCIGQLPDSGWAPWRPNGLVRQRQS